MQQLKIANAYRLATKRRVRLELSADTLLRLLKNGEVSASSFRCLDRDSKQCVRQLLLDSLGHSFLPCSDLCHQTQCPRKTLKGEGNSPMPEPWGDASPIVFTAPVNDL